MATPTGGSTESRVQAFIHAVEQGSYAAFVRKFLMVVVLVAVGLIELGWNFRGLALPEAMDQAQIARQIVTGHGWSTRFIRPLAIWQIETNLGAAPKGDFPDTYNAPLPPLVNALAVKLAGSKQEFKSGEYILPVERFIVALSMLIFLSSVGVEYLLLRRLFDERLAFWGCVLTLLSNLCWEFTLSGLPQMLMLLIFNLALYALTRAVESNVALQAIDAGEAPPQRDGAPVRATRGAVLQWLAVAGAMFALLVLCHGLASWIFLGALIFAGGYFRDRGPVLLVFLGVFALVYAPWLVRTYHVSGSPFGTAGFAMFDGINSTTNLRMRSVDGPSTDTVAPRFFRPKLEAGTVAGVQELVRNTGNVLVVGFFIGLLHLFRRRETGAIRWAVLVMWLVLLLGAAATTTHANSTTGVHPDQLDILFLPVMLGYGLAFVLVLFTRRDANAGPLPRVILFAILLLVSGLPLLLSLLPHNQLPYQYPPYLEPAINKLAAWTTEDEIIGSDMPWAVAWYANRKSLWIPNKLQDFLSLSDNARLNGRLIGLFLTPISRDTPFLSGLYKGEYQEYQTPIFGRVDMPLFPFNQQVLMLGDLSYSFAADTKRWEKPAPTK